MYAGNSKFLNQNSSISLFFLNLCCSYTTKIFLNSQLLYLTVKIHPLICKSQEFSAKNKDHLESYCIAKEVAIHSKLNEKVVARHKGFVQQKIQRITNGCMEEKRRHKTSKRSQRSKNKKLDTLDLELCNLVHEKEIQDEELHIREEIKTLNNKVHNYNINSYTISRDVHMCIISMMTDIWNYLRRTFMFLQLVFFYVSTLVAAN